MAIQLPIVNTAADTFADLVLKTNSIINTVANSVITANTNANGATTTGNAYIIGIVGGTTIVATTLRGGNVQSSANLTISSNAIFTGNLITLGANITINTSSLVIGANLVLTDSLLRFGNSTVNSVINSTAWVLGPNLTITGTSISLGNSSSNALINSTAIFIGGVALPYANNRDSVAINGSLIGTGTRINFSSTGSASVTASVDAGNSQVNVVISSSLTLAGGAGGVNTNILFNDSTAIAGLAGFTFDKTTNNVFIANTITIGTTVVNSTSFFSGNSTVNTTANSTVDSFSNSTLTSSYGLGGINIGGINIVNTSVFFSGNSTVNSVSNATIDVFSNSTVSSSFGIGGLVVGANVTVGVNGSSYGNSTVNVVANSTTLNFSGGAATLSGTVLTIGANVVVNTSLILIGNSTASWVGNSTSMQVGNATSAALLTPAGFTVIGGASSFLNSAGVTTPSGTFTGAVSAGSFIGTGIAVASQYWANTAGKVMTTDALNLSGAYVGLTDAATIVWDMSTGINFFVTLGGNRTLANPTNVVVGRSGILQVKEDGTGGRTLSYGANYIFDSDVAPVIGTGALKENYLYYHCVTASRILITLAAKAV